MATKRLSRVKSNSKIFKTLCVCALAALFLNGCGAEDPFSRGEYLDEVEKSLSEDDVDDGGQEKLVLSRAVFEQQLLPAFQKSKCTMCHAHITGSYETALNWVVIGAPQNSPLYIKAVGHKHKAIWQPESSEAQLLYQWILAE